MEINYILTETQMEDICKAFGKNPSNLEDWEVCELLDKIIDEYVSTEH